MNKALLILIILVSSIICLRGINHMDIIQTMTGEFAGSEFGNSMASIDFNADGYDDLVVCSSAWNPNGVYNEQQLFGKLYYYWGGPNFDNIPDMVISGTHFGHCYGIGFFNAGDISGDGLDDLIISSRDSLGIGSINIYYSRINPRTVPDITLSYPLSLTEGVYAYPLGDINGDSHADLGLFYTGDLDRYNRRLLILTDVNVQPTVFYETNNYIGTSLLSGVGDVNNDSIEDFFMHIPISGMGDTDMRLMLYYGNSNFPIIDSLVISDNTHQVVTNWGCPVGDVNGDGIDDFVAYNYHLWLGSPNLTANWNMTLNSDYGYSEAGFGYPFQYGDFNNDGFDDIVCTNHGYGWNSGVANIWLGRSQMNGTQDLVIFPPENYQDRNFGWAKATGDFNGDGFCDIAVSAPWWNENDHNQTGKVFVYAGNALLQDTTVANEDDTMPNLNAKKWDINIHPNPIKNKNIPLNIEFVGNGYKQAHDIKAKIFNLKGQLLQTFKINSTTLKSGSWSGTLQETTSGVYLISVYDKSNKLITKKITVID